MNKDDQIERRAEVLEIEKERRLIDRFKSYGVIGAVFVGWGITWQANSGDLKSNTLRIAKLEALNEQLTAQVNRIDTDYQKAITKLSEEMKGISKSMDRIENKLDNFSSFSVGGVNVANDKRRK